MSPEESEQLVKSDDPDHPANLIPELCKKFYQLGWVTGTTHSGAFDAPASS
jgi:methylthioribulose-1-phosphate dehydratase